MKTKTKSPRARAEAAPPKPAHAVPRRKAIAAPRNDPRRSTSNRLAIPTTVNPKPRTRNSRISESRRQRSLSTFDPTLPLDGALVEADVLRDQFNGLFVMVQSIPAGPPGPQGEQGPPFSTAIVDGVTTLSPGDPAWVTSYFDGTNVHLSFGLPKGYDGGTGQQGIQGEPGTNGAPGPPFAQAIVDGVSTLPPGSDATVTVSFDGTYVHFTFGIPSGLQGNPGADGAPGEVTLAQLDSAITTAVSGTSTNTNVVATLDTPFPDPDSETLRLKMNEFILAARR